MPGSCLPTRNRGKPRPRRRIALQRRPNGFRRCTCWARPSSIREEADEALPVLQQTAAAAPDATGPKMQLGRIYLSRGDVKSALTFARDAVAVAPNQALPRRCWSACSLLSAMPSVPRQALTAAPGVFAVRGSPDRGRRRRVRKGRPGSRSPRLHSCVGHESCARSMPWTEWPAVHLSTGKTAEALSLARKSVAAYPTDPRLLIVGGTHASRRKGRTSGGSTAAASDQAFPLVA